MVTPSNLPGSSLAGYDFSNLGLSQNTSGGLNSSAYTAPQPQNPINFGVTYGPPVPTSTSNGGVLGASTVNTTAPVAKTTQPTSSNQNKSSGGGGWQNLPGYAGWDPAAAAADYAATGGAGKGANTNGGFDISDIYQPSLDALGGIENSIRTGAGDIANYINSQYDTAKTNIGNEQTDLQNNLNEQGDRFNKGVQQAYSEAVRYLNGLQQQGMSRYGQGSSLGGAVGELANQEFLRNQGNIQDQTLQGQQALADQGVKMKNYVTQKLGDLDNWKQSAILQNNQDLQSKLGEIGMRRGDIEANKTRDRIAALQDAMNNARQIQQRSEQFRQSLGTWAVQQAQASSNRTFTPEEIAGIYNSMVNQTLSGFTGQNVAPDPSLLLAQGRKVGGNNNDIFQQLGINNG